MFDGEKLLTILEVKKIGVRELASKIGVSPAAVYRWINGDRQPRVTHYVKMLKVLKIKKLEQLLQEEKEAMDV